MTTERLVLRARKRFDRRVNKRGATPVAHPGLGPCWEWTGHTCRLGYGAVWFLRAMQKAHRVAFFLEHGRWPEPCCLHRCDNRRCVNPAHLVEGTHAENMADMASKGRAVLPRLRGERCPWAKLTPEAVRDIRAALARGEVQASIAKRHGVSRSTVNNVAMGRDWTHVPLELDGLEARTGTDG